MKETTGNYRWKVTNDEGFIPVVNFYQSDRATARLEDRDGYDVTIVGGVLE